MFCVAVNFIGIYYYTKQPYRAGSPCGRKDTFYVSYNPENFFVPLSSPNRLVYWECISRLFAIMEHQLSFGVEREVLVEELEFYFNQENAAQLVEEEFTANDSRGRANGILRRLEYYGMD